MLVNIDAKSLEICCAADLSKDAVLISELMNKVDIHEHNRIRFGLPTRLLAKTFVFRLIYGGSAYSYTNDPSFTGISKREEFWQNVIDEFYKKYAGIHVWHKAMMRKVIETGEITIPTGRAWKFSKQFGFDGNLKDSRIIKNYPVQGYGADLVMLARVDMYRRVKRLGFKTMFVNTVHDSIVLDSPDCEVASIVGVAKETFRDLPIRVKQTWGYDFSVPMFCEVLIGRNWFDMEEYT